MEVQESKAVYVTNISPNANEKTVSDFFSFCGKISHLYLKKDEGSDTSTAVVQFETESASKTALLLTNALIIDRPITVLPYAQTQTGATVPQVSPTVVSTSNAVPESNITQRDFQVPDEQRSKTSVVASLLAAGYVLANDAFDKAKEVDEKNNISLQVKVALEQVKVKAHEIDKQLGISEKAASIQKEVSEKAKQFDETYHLSEKANQAATTVKSTATATAKTISSNPTVAKGIDTISSTATSLKASVTTAYNDYKEQTQKAIEEKQKEKVSKKPNLLEGPSSTEEQKVESNLSNEPTQTPQTDQSNAPQQN